MIPPDPSEALASRKVTDEERYFLDLATKEPVNSLARPDATGTSEVVVTCLHCDKQVVLTIPRVYIEADALVRWLTSRPMPQ